MRFFFVCYGSALIGVFTTLIGVGWFNKGHFNPVGGNVVAVAIWCFVTYVIFEKKDSK